MKTNILRSLATGSAIIFLMMATSLYAETPDPLSQGNEKVVDKIAEQFADLAADDLKVLITTLRTGGPLSYTIEVEQPVLDDLGNPVMTEVENPDGTTSLVPLTEIVIETIEVENTLGPMGFGNIKLALGLTEATLPEGATHQDLVTALFNSDAQSGILDMRAADMGWGDIYHSFDLKVGEIMREKNAIKPDRPTTAVRANKPAKPEKPEKPAKPEKPDKPDKPEKPEKPNRPNRP